MQNGTRKWVVEVLSICAVLLGNSTVQYSALKCSTVHYSNVQYNALKSITMHYSAVPGVPIQCGAWSLGGKCGTLHWTTSGLGDFSF